MRTSRLSKILDKWIATYPAFEDVFIPLRGEVIRSKYRKKREHYTKICEEKGLVYSEEDTIKRVKRRLNDRGYAPSKHRQGDVHTFAFIPKIGWHEHLYPDLYELGPVTEFDYIKLGYNNINVAKPNKEGRELRKKLNDEWYDALVKSHKEKPVDWVFVYASGNHVLAETIRRIQETIGIPVVNMCLDDKQSWEGLWLGEQRGLQIDIAKVFDLSWTSARVAVDWYLAEGGIPLYLPEGVNTHVYKPMSGYRDLDVSFVGAAYGCRPSIIRYLKKYGLSVQCYGSGWEEGSISQDLQIEIFNRSKVNLGIGAIGYAEYLTNLKGRDFEIPGCGGGMYLTSFNPDLALHFDIGKEMVCYRSRDEMLELIRYYLKHPDEAQLIAKEGRERCLREHRWKHRYLKILKILGIADNCE